MAITIKQFDGQYISADLAEMNAEVAAALEHFGVGEADLTDFDRSRIIREIENNVSGRYVPGCPCGTLDDLLSPAWRRLISHDPR